MPGDIPIGVLKGLRDRTGQRYELYTVQDALGYYRKSPEGTEG